MTKPKCPHHKTEMFMIYGNGWDYDRWICTERDGLVACMHEIELDVTSYPEDGLYNEKSQKEEKDGRPKK